MVMQMRFIFILFSIASTIFFIKSYFLKFKKIRIRVLQHVNAPF